MITWLYKFSAMAQITQHTEYSWTFLSNLLSFWGGIEAEMSLSPILTEPSIITQESSLVRSHIS